MLTTHEFEFRCVFICLLLVDRLLACAQSKNRATIAGHQAMLSTGARLGWCDCHQPGLPSDSGTFAGDCRPTGFEMCELRQCGGEIPAPRPVNSLLPSGRSVMPCCPRAPQPQTGTTRGTSTNTCVQALLSLPLDFRDTTQQNECGRPTVRTCKLVVGAICQVVAVPVQRPNRSRLLRARVTSGANDR